MNGGLRIHGSEDVMKAVTTGAIRNPGRAELQCNAVNAVLEGPDSSGGHIVASHQFLVVVALRADAGHLRAVDAGFELFRFRDVVLTVTSRADGDVRDAFEEV